MIFPAPEERHDTSSGVIVFWGQDMAQRVRCAISREALDDHFHGDNRDKLEVFRENRPAIEDIARSKYLSGRVEPDGTVLIRTADILQGGGVALLELMMIMLTTVECVVRRVPLHSEHCVIGREGRLCD
ncbi:MAG: DUF1488 domain-containing protein [Terracidiphilus sp.]